MLECRWTILVGGPASCHWEEANAETELVPHKEGGDEKVVRVTA